MKLDCCSSTGLPTNQRRHPRHPLQSLLTITQRQAKCSATKLYDSIISNARLFLIKFTFEKLLPFSVNYNMSTSGNLKGEKNVDFDNFMMIAYI